MYKFCCSKSDPVLKETIIIAPTLLPVHSPQLEAFAIVDRSTAKKTFVFKMNLYLILFTLSIATACNGALLEGLLNTALNVNTKVHNVASSFFGSLAENIRPEQNTPNYNSNGNSYPIQPQQNYAMPTNNGNLNDQYGNPNNQQANFNNQPGYNNPTGNYVNQPGYQNPNSNGNNNPAASYVNQPGNQNPNNNWNQPASTHNNLLSTQNPKDGREGLNIPGFTTETLIQIKPKYNDKDVEDIFKNM